ncbi:Thiamin diphosphate-binding protein [Protomyces lactucae-debilis]|uniref:2-oxoglutarate dehydrogenase, mitochondrial n=1 Tax=Protomyces lactucae-debilis TaxID=2754530 RepID=A0A1Y2F7Y5_PROLT|nr:thiamine diphosphate-binding protein [Protomyces lactucae-debilis]ORY80001.1 Thiamin diphosphate-binding protein [Protomyces lactucae-debilis]
MQSNSANYIDEMYAAWKQEPTSVHISWQVYFKNMENGGEPSQAFQAPPTIVPTPTGGVPSIVPGEGLAKGTDVSNHLKVQLLVRAYQVRGHHNAKLDPLEISNVDKTKPNELTLEHYGFTQADLSKEYTLGPGILPRFAADGREKMTLKEIVEACEKLYCGSYGVEYVHIPDRDQCDWLRERLEVPEPYKYSQDEKRRIMDRLIWSDSFERFLSTKHPNDKRFGLEGCEALIPGMKELIDDSVERGIESIVIGMPHRGRLNVLANVVRKPAEAIFSEFAGSQEASDEGSGDVKYHLGMNYERPTPSGKRVNLSLVANPSHLEAEDPVVLGKTRAIQHFSNDEREHNKAMGLLLHGDAAFAGQGVVYETLGMHALPGYSTGGTIHIVVNNQIGFTTDPRFSRSTPYCSDIAKSIDAPIFHVNGDDVEAVTFICKLASEWRAVFKKDVVVDIVCYRKHGHNETDQPSFTQPLMYKKIAEHAPTLDLYIKQLTQEKTFTPEDIEEHKKWVWGILEENFQKSKDYEPSSKDWLTAAWNGFASPKDLATKILPHLPTAVEEAELKSIGKVISSFPKDFTVHKNLKRIIEQRGKAVDKGEGIDWATGEALAFGSLLKEGHHIRVSGQDVERGTFSQRHAVLHDQETEKTFVNLNALDPKQAAFVIVNSHLSEFGALGYEYGYSLSSPNALVMWEAQFGDFANNAQCIIDQFIASGENKWLQRSGLVMSLPHGYDGQGPEHSSARIERYLQLSNDDPRIYPSEAKLDRQHQDCNMQCVYPTTPANLFHVLRRQIHREFRKPLILFFSKALLRHPIAKSPLSDFTGESHFQRVISEVDESIKAPSECKRLVLCSGQVYATLVKARQDNQINDIGIIRVEQFMPFPWERLHEEFDKYSNAKEIVWCQEEPLNGGAWSYVQPRINTCLKKTTHPDKVVKYAGRAPTSSVATGNKKSHEREVKKFTEEALDLQPLME